MLAETRKLNFDVFTPLSEDRRTRLNFTNVLVYEGQPEACKLGKKGKIFIDGRAYQVVGISCGSRRCNCDAYIKPFGVDAMTRAKANV